MNVLDVPIHIAEHASIARANEPFRIGVPLPRGVLHDVSAVEVVGPRGSLPYQADVLAAWPDGSAKWLLLQSVVTIAAGERLTVHLRHATEPQRPPPPQLPVSITDKGIEVDTGKAVFTVATNRPGLLSACIGGRELLAESGARLTLTAGGLSHAGLLTDLVLEEHGSLSATVRASGRFPTLQAPLEFVCRATFTAGSALVAVDVQIRNPQAALHPGGLWDLGDPGSILLEDLSFELQPSEPMVELRWRAEQADEPRSQSTDSWTLYQDSSGGERWNSPNHVDSSSQPTVRFRGYRVSTADVEIASGLRATPALRAASSSAWFALGVRDFWQNFPKALRWRGNACSVGLFPSEAKQRFELQGGERKRHTLYVEFGLLDADRDRIGNCQKPVSVYVDPGWVESSRAITAFVTAANDGNQRYKDYVQQIVDGPKSFAARREIIDEYGWRNFGDLYADHEAVNHSGPAPFISHYNNQYDFIYGAFLQAHRTGDPRWGELMEDAARHMIDIDIYHTTRDKSSFSGGLFWHTDHYLPAATSTHRAYSRSNGVKNYGGGPSNEQNYTTGLLHYYYTTGDREAAAAVLTLANWVCAMDDGAQNMLGLVDDGPTGLASSSRDRDFHKPGRGAGNSINALMDAYSVSGQRRYLDKADELIRRCIHPADDVPSLSLDDPENRWSYLVFLQVLGKYLDRKLELGETDYEFWYSREALLHYARWIAEHESPYKDVLHKVEIPTETWPAHDIRKCHVLHYAAKYCDAPEHSGFKDRANFFFVRCMDDLLSFATSDLTRPLVILCVYGLIQGYFETLDRPQELPQKPLYGFGEPQAFMPQRARLIHTLRSKLRVFKTDVLRIGNQQLRALVIRRPK